jgi:hypothetical protein
MSNGFQQDTLPPDPSSIKWVTFGPGGDLILGIVSLLRLLATPPDEPSRPAKAYEHPVEAARQTFQGVYYIAKDEWGVFSAFAYLLAGIAGLVVLLGGVLGEILLWLFKNVLPEFAIAGLEFIDAFRKDLDPVIPRVSVLTLNELLGSDLTADDFPGDEDVAGHVARAEKIGRLFLNQFKSEITSSNNVEDIDGEAGAAKFAGMIVNFGVSTALLGLAGELSSAGLFKDFRLIGEQVSSGLGLSKQMRLAIKPLLKTLVATPFQYDLNQQFHPQRFTTAEVVNPFAQTLMDHDLIVKDLELQGWEPARAEALIRLHAKRLTLADVELFDRYGITARDATLSLLKELGYLEDVAGAAIQAEDLKRTDAVLKTLVDAIETRVIDGQISVEEFSTLLDSLPLGFYEKKFRLQTVQYKTKSPHKSLTIAEAQSAFEQGLWTLDELQAYFTKVGFSADDNAVITALTLIKFVQLDEAKKVAQFAWEKKVAAAQKKGLPIPPKPAILAG